MRKSALSLPLLALLAVYPVKMVADNADLSAHLEKQQLREDPDEILLEKGLSLYILPSSAASSDESLETQREGVHFVLSDLPDPQGTLKAKLSDLFLGKQITMKLVETLKTAIVEHYQQEHRPVVKAILPPQNLADGSLKLVVLESKVGKLEFQGNKWFSDQRLQKCVRLHSGDRVSDKTLAEDLYWINRNPFRQTNLLFVPGSGQTTDLAFITDDRFPLRIYAGADNTGIDPIQQGRIFGGFNWGNAFWIDHTLSYQYSTAPNSWRFNSHTLNYTAPLPWRHVLALFGGYSEVHPHLDDNFTSHGKSGQGSFRYEIPFGFTQKLLQEFSFGCDYKITNNNFFFGDTFVFARTVSLFQAMLGYNIGLETERSKTRIDAMVFYSPGAFLPNQETKDYNLLRPGAKPSYVYGRALIQPTFLWPGTMELGFNLAFQASSANLLASEQYTLGGYGTVRGYDEKIITTDNAVCASAELRTTVFPILSHRLNKKVEDGLQFLGFIDYGIGKNHDDVWQWRGTEYLLGVGPGLRYSIQRTVSARLDLGFPLHSISGFNNSPKWHASFILSF